MNANSYFNIGSLIPVNPDAGRTRFDYMVRLRANDTQLIVVGAATNVLADEMHRLIRQHIEPSTRACQALGLVIDRMKLRESYNNHYRDYLLGQMSEDDFQKVAEEYAYTPTHANVVELSEQLHALLAFTTEEFTTSEVAELFRVDESDVATAMTMQLPLFDGLDFQISR